jgi:hypothetical protein
MASRFSIKSVFEDLYTKTACHSEVSLAKRAIVRSISDEGLEHLVPLSPFVDAFKHSGSHDLHRPKLQTNTSPALHAICLSITIEYTMA